MDMNIIHSRLAKIEEGCDVFYKDETDSTNSLALRNIKDGVLKNIRSTVFVADRQTAGRGRRGRIWESHQNESLTFSIAIKPMLDKQLIPILTIVAGLAVAEAIRSLTKLEVLIKWPNDIVINGKKVCGILAETDATLQYVVVGFGVNIGKCEWDSELLEKATSIEDETGVCITREKVLVEITSRFLEYCTVVEKQNGLGKLRAKYEKCLIRRGETIVVDNKRYMENGIDDYGRLLVTDENTGEKACLSGGELSIRGVYGYI